MRVLFRIRSYVIVAVPLAVIICPSSAMIAYGGWGAKHLFAGKDAVMC